jgi:hypothetical protein
MKNMFSRLFMIVLIAGFNPALFAADSDSAALIVSTKQGLLRGIAAGH